MLASRAIIGMLEVLAMTTVRSASGPPVRGSIELGELADHVGHLVATLAAADVDDDVGVAPLGDLLQQHRLAGAEPAGDPDRAAARHGEQQVDDPLAGEQRARRRRRARSVRSRLADRPPGREPDLLATDAAHHRVPGGRNPAPASHVSSPLSPGGTSTGSADPSGSIVPSRSPGLAAAPSVDRGDELPLALGEEPSDRPRGQERARAGQRPQQAVEDPTEQSRTEGDGQRLAAGPRRVTGSQAHRCTRRPAG